MATQQYYTPPTSGAARRRVPSAPARGRPASRGAVRVAVFRRLDYGPALERVPTLEESERREREEAEARARAPKRPRGGVMENLKRQRRAEREAEQRRSHQRRSQSGDYSDDSAQPVAKRARRAITTAASAPAPGPSAALVVAPNLRVCNNLSVVVVLLAHAIASACLLCVHVHHSPRIRSCTLTSSSPHALPPKCAFGTSVRWA
jgi:hypothetical protein